MAERIPATVVTGFLGAGKTTLIRNLLANAEGKRIALIVNEFGDVGVDGSLLSDCGDAACEVDDVVELANGCICCTVADDFIPTMEMLLERQPAPDHIVIETSGLALPQPLVQAFNWPEVKARVTVDGVVTVVDTPAVADGRFAANVQAVEAQRAADDNLDHESPLHELFEDQLVCADLIVLNKTDLVEGDVVENVTEMIGREKREAAQVVRAVEGKLPSALIIGQGIGAETDLATRKSHHEHGHDHDHHHDDDHDDHHHHEHDHDDFESFVVDVPPVGDVKAFEQRVMDMIVENDVLRAKGFIEVDGKPMRLAVQAVGPRIDSYFDRRWRDDETRKGQLVVIGLKGLNQSAIETALQGELV
ncbi:MAG: cobalamin biosynthesis protein CobW [Pseudomonadota bacterium]